MSRTRQVGPFGRSDLRKSGTDANSRASKPTDRRSRPTDSRNAGSSSITKMGGPDSDITSTRKPVELSTIYRRNKPFRRETGPKPKFSGSGLVAAVVVTTHGSSHARAATLLSARV